MAKKGNIGKQLDSESESNVVEHVMPVGNGWAVKSSKSAKFTVITDSKKEAVEIARSKAKAGNAQLVVHDKSGKILEKVSYAR